MQLWWIQKPFFFTAVANGQDINAFYDIGTKLGSGAFSIVKRAKDRQTGEDVAVKIIDKGRIRIALMERELAILQKVRHPNVLPFYGAFEDKKNVFLVMELAKGGELFDQLISRGSYSEEDASVIIKQVLLGVQYLHSVGVAHRDLKLENILCKSHDAKTFHVYIADFGLSRIFEEEEIGQMFTQVGSLEYCAPEILKGVPYEKEVDIWSVGVVTYTLLTGCFPFFSATKSNVELVNKITACSYNWSGFPDVSNRARDFVAKLLMMDPKARMTSEQALNHPWIKGEQSRSKLSNSYQNLLQFRKKD